MMIEKEKRKSRRVAEDKVEITFRLTRELTISIKKKAVEEGRSYSDVVEEGMQKFLAKSKVSQGDNR